MHTEEQIDAALKAFWKASGMDDREWMRAALAAAQAAGVSESDEVEAMVHALSSTGSFPRVSMSHSGGLDYWRGLMRKALRAARALSPPASAETRREVTGNPCGTDTWALGQPCQCEACQAYLRQNPDPRFSPPSASAPAGAPSEWRSRVKADALAVIEEWYQDQKITLTVEQMDALAKEIAECIPSG